MNEIIFRDGRIVPIKSYFRYSPCRVEFYTAEGDHYIYIEKEFDAYGKKFTNGAFFRRIFSDPYLIEYIEDGDIESVIFGESEE